MGSSTSKKGGDKIGVGKTGRTRANNVDAKVKS